MNNFPSGTLSDPSLNPNPRWGFSKLHFVHSFDGLNPLEGELGDSSNSEPVEHGVSNTVGRVVVGWAGDGRGQGYTGSCGNDPDIKVILGSLVGDGQGLGDVQGEGQHLHVHHEDLLGQGVLVVPLGHHPLGCSICGRAGLEVGKIT